MNYELLFKIANASVMPAWLLLIALPKHKVTRFVSHSYLYPFALGGLYIFLLVISWGGEGGMDTLANLKLSFGRNEVLVLGWVHYLVFDLFIGGWITRDAAQVGINHLTIVPMLILTLFLGPVGLLLYLVYRLIITKNWML